MSVSVVGLSPLAALWQVFWHWDAGSGTFLLFFGGGGEERAWTRGVVSAGS